MRGGIDSPGEATDNGHSGVGELVGEFFCTIRSVVRGLAGSDDSEGVTVAFQDFAHHVKDGRRIVDFPEQGGVIGRGEGDNFRAVLFHEGEFPGEVHVAFPIAQGFRGLGADPLDGLQTRSGGREHGRRRSKGLQ